MKKIILLLLSVIVFSCSNSDQPNTNNQQNQVPETYSANIQALGMTLTSKPAFTSDNITFNNYCNWYEIKNNSQTVGYGILLELNKQPGVKGADLYVEINSPTLTSGNTYDLSSGGSEITFPVNDVYSLNSLPNKVKSVTITNISDNKISGTVNIAMRKNLTPFPETIVTGSFTKIPKL